MNLSKKHHSLTLIWSKSKNNNLKPLNLVSLNHRIMLRNSITPHNLEIKRALMLLGVPVGPAKRGPTLAHEPSQTHFLLAAAASVRRRRRVTARRWISRDGRGGICRTSRRISGGGGDGDEKGFLDGGFGGGGAFALGDGFAVALGAEVAVAGGAEEAAVVGAGFWFRRGGVAHAIVLLRTHVVVGDWLMILDSWWFVV